LKTDDPTGDPTAAPSAPTLPSWLPAAFRAAAVGLIYWMTAAAVLGSFLDQWALGDKWRKSRFHKAVHFTAPRPFAYRVLTPWLVREIAERLPAAARRELAEQTEALRRRYALRPGNDVEYAVAYYLLLAAYLGTMLAWRASFRVLGRGSPLLWDVAPAVALLLLPLTFGRGGFLYDPLELALTGLALCFFLRRSWIPYYLTFLLALLNKEADVLLPVWLLAPLTIDRDWRFFLRHAALSVAVGAPPFLLVRWWFRRSPGNPLTPMWEKNLTFLTDPNSYWSGFEAYAPGVQAPHAFHALNLFLLGTLLALVWRRAYLREVRLIFLYSVLAYLPFFLLFGWKDEVRVFAPAFAAFVLLAAHGLREATCGADPREPRGSGALSA
jgi:hypothetical protein